MYLVATAMRLAPCALGSGDADLAARALGLDYLRESSVGDFLLGSRPPDEAAGPVPERWQAVNDAGWAIAARTMLAAAPASASSGQVEGGAPETAGGSGSGTAGA
jgi:hypothetical protein